MKSSKPPTPAAWLLERLAARENREALAGDLSEQFNQGRSVAWYWRQVLAAIFVGFANQLCSQWVAVSLSGLCTGIFMALAIHAPVWSVPLLSSFHGWALRLDWPLSFICLTILYLAVAAVEFLAAVGLYLALRRRFDLRHLLWGTLVGLLVYVGVNTVLGLSIWLFLDPDHPGLLGLVIGYLTLFFSLLVSMWLAGSHDQRRRAAAISA